MGKSNRIRVNRVDAKLSAPKKKQQGMPGWAVSLLAIVITVAIIASAALLILSSNGVFGRMKVAMQSENYKVNRNSFSYYFMSVYSNFQTDYESYLSSFSLDTSKPLKDQVYGQSNGGYAYESYYLGSFEGTWYDYFMQQTTEQVKTTLLYCEAARALDVELDDEDYASIDSTIANLETTASLYGTTLNTYLASSYGAGVGVKDVKKALELSALATKCSELISEEVIEAVTEDMINDEYADNRVDYDLIDYLMYTVSVKYEDAVKAVLGDDYNENYELDEEQEAAVKAKYIELIDEAEALADEFAAIETEEEFYDTIVNYMLSKAYDEAYDKVDFADEADPIPEPSEADKKTVKEKTIASILAAFEANKDKDDATVSGDAKKNDDGKWMLYDIEVDAEYATELNTIYKNLYANFVTNEDTFTKEGVSFSDTNEFILGAFKDLLGSEEETEEVDKVDVGGTKVLYAGDEDLADQDDDYVMYEYYNANVYMLTKAPYQDADYAKNISYILATDKALINSIVEAIGEMETVDAESFAAIVKESEFSSAYHYTYEDYVKGGFGVAAFDNWLFDKKTVEGSVSGTLTLDESTENGTTTGTYCVAFFDENGHQNWYVASKDTVLNETYDARDAEIRDTYTVEINDKVLATIDA